MLEMVKEHLDGNTSSCEAGRAAHAIRVDPDNLANLGFLFHRHNFNLAFLAAFRKATPWPCHRDWPLERRFNGLWRTRNFERFSAPVSNLTSPWCLSVPPP